MDKILQDVMKQRIQNSADRDAKRRFQRSPRTPGSTPVKPSSGSSNNSPSKVSTETSSTTAVGTSSSSMVTPVTNTENSEIKPQEMETASSTESQNTAVKWSIQLLLHALITVTNTCLQIPAQDLWQKTLCKVWASL